MTWRATSLIEIRERVYFFPSVLYSDVLGYLSKNDVSPEFSY